MKSTKFSLIFLLSIVKYIHVESQFMGPELIDATKYGQLHLNCPPIDDPAHPVRLMYPSDCRMYYLCAGGKAYTQLCPNNLYWSQLTLSCDRIELSNCASMPTTVPTNQPLAVTPALVCLSQNFSPMPGNPNHFYEICERRCAVGYEWNVKTQQCTLPNEVIWNRPVKPYLPISPISDPTTIIPPNAIIPSTNGNNQFMDNSSLEVICNGGGQMYLPYPGDCTKFIQCDYKPFVKYCPPFLLWNSKLNTCDKVCI